MLALFVTLLMGSSALAQQQQYFGQRFTGEATYYGDGTVATGNCAFGEAGAQRQPWVSGIRNFVAINDPQWANGLPCGMCVAYRATSGGLGTTPISSTWRYAMVCDRCPECHHGDLDMAVNGDGRWNFEWMPVQCNTGQTAFRYYTTATSHNWYTKLKVTNSRVPIQAVALQSGTSWIPLRRTMDFYWEHSTGITYPAKFRITSILGGTIMDTVATGGPGLNSRGRAQFPANPAFPLRVGGGGLPRASLADTSSSLASDVGADDDMPAGNGTAVSDGPAGNSTMPDDSGLVVDDGEVLIPEPVEVPEPDDVVDWGAVVQDVLNGTADGNPGVPPVDAVVDTVAAVAGDLSRVVKDIGSSAIAQALKGQGNAGDMVSKLMAGLGLGKRRRLQQQEQQQQ